MKIEVGKTYRTRGGDKVMITGCWEGLIYPFISGKGTAYTDDGRYWNDGDESQEDLIAEWTDTPEFGASRANQGPVREVTRKEIVPGVYGKVKVWEDCSEGGMAVDVNPNRLDKAGITELTDAITTLTQIRDAMADSSAT